MRVLYISDRGDGGIKRHVRTIRACLPHGVESFVIGEDEPFAGTSGHDVREFFQIRRVMRAFRPDVVHFHTTPLLMLLYVALRRLLSFGRGPKVVCSWHLPTNRPPRLVDRVFLFLLGRDCYFLPVSQATWKGLKAWRSGIRGEVFYNPIRVGKPGATPPEGGADSSSASSDAWPTRRTGVAS